MNPEYFKGAICVKKSNGIEYPYVLTENDAHKLCAITKTEKENITGLTSGEEFETAKAKLHLQDFKVSKILKLESKDFLAESILRVRHTYYVCTLESLKESVEENTEEKCYQIFFQDDENSDCCGEEFISAKDAIDYIVREVGTSTSYFSDYIGGTAEIFDKEKEEVLFYANI